MYFRPFVREDDSLTPGSGVVKPKPQRYPVTHNGKLACYEGDLCIATPARAGA